MSKGSSTIWHRTGSKSRPILDALEAIGVTGKTHSSSIEADQAERVRITSAAEAARKCVEAAG